MRSLFVLTCLLAVASGCGPDLSDPFGPYDGRAYDGTLTVDNASASTLIELRVTPVRSNDWGPNLLRDRLFPGERVTIRVACDTWDVLAVDEFGRQCLLPALDLCASDRFWTIDERTLASCRS